MSCHVRNHICHQPESMCDNIHQKMPLGFLLKAYGEKHQHNFKKCRLRTSCHTGSHSTTTPRHATSNKPDFSHNCCIKSTSFGSLISKTTQTIRQTFYNLWSFMVMVGEQVAVCQRKPHVRITKHFQPSHNCAVITIRGFFWILQAAEKLLL